MFWVLLLVALSPALNFNGLTLENLLGFFNFHPFLFLFIIEVLCSGTKYVSIIKNWDK